MQNLLMWRLKENLKLIKFIEHRERGRVLLRSSRWSLRPLQASTWTPSCPSALRRLQARHRRQSALRQEHKLKNVKLPATSWKTFPLPFWPWPHFLRVRRKQQAWGWRTVTNSSQPARHCSPLQRKRSGGPSTASGSRLTRKTAFYCAF